MMQQTKLNKGDNMGRYLFDHRSGWCDHCGEELVFGSFDDNDRIDLCFECQQESDEEDE